MIVRRCPCSATGGRGGRLRGVEAVGRRGFSKAMKAAHSTIELRDRSARKARSGVGSPFSIPHSTFGLRRVGDRYLSSYTYGPLGLISRTIEDPDATRGNPVNFGDNDPANNREVYYLRDAMGGHGRKFEVQSSKIEKRTGHGATKPRSHKGRARHGSSHSTFAIRHSPFRFDAFGNDPPISPLGKGGPQGGGALLEAGSFAWHGGEGSLTDPEPNLDHIQVRHGDWPGRQRRREGAPKFAFRSARAPLAACLPVSARACP